MWDIALGTTVRNLGVLSLNQCFSAVAEHWNLLEL